MIDVGAYPSNMGWLLLVILRRVECTVKFGC